MNNPDWKFWDAYGEVEIWQAVALSLNLDPDELTQQQIRRINGYSSYWCDFTGEQDVEKEIDKRQRLVEKRFGMKDDFGMLDSDGECPYCNTAVSATDVARYLVSVGRNIPKELELLLDSTDTGAICNALAPVQSKNDADASHGNNEERRKFRDQEEAIVEALVELGYSPKMLPPNNSGKKGVKSEVRNALNGNPLFRASSAFNKAWERATEMKDIAYANPTPPK
jgi:hypothetical protein